MQDILFDSRQVVLGKHKRSRTQKRTTVRQVTLNDDAFAIFQRQCRDKARTDRVFVNNDGRPWTVRALAKRFERTKEIAAALNMGAVRPEITIYDYRHLWISEMLMAPATPGDTGDDRMVVVARMAGTSIAMIEQVYGHLRNQHLHNAQARLDNMRRKRGR